MLSDGKPLDCGCEQYSGPYAQNDVKKALQEARTDWNPNRFVLLSIPMDKIIWKKLWEIRIFGHYPTFRFALSFTQNCTGD